MLRAIVCFLFLCTAVQGSAVRNQITIRDGGYENLLIAINKDVAEDQTIVDTLIDIFTSGSGYLFTATKRRTYWRNITILIPNTWTPKPEYERARTESFETANVIVDAENPAWEDNPYTLQLGGCGVHGEYIHLTPNFLLDRENSEYIWGPMDKLLLHEWGHLRWGLFDEYHTEDEGSSKFYADSRGNIEATRCSTKLTGEALNINTFEQCQRDPETGLYEADCFFFPNLNGQTEPASIMYAQFLESVTDYCHSNPELPGYHNREAPNKHNNLCSSRSAWDVMLETDDFARENNPPFEEDIDTTPTFRLVQASTRRVALVLDVSGSMGTNDRLAKLNQAATQYLRYTIEDGSMMAITKFSYSAEIIVELTEIYNETNREYLISNLPNVPDGSTCIGCGILAGIQALKGPSREEDPAGGYILLVSDGEENVFPYIINVLDQVVESGVIIDTIAFSPQADPKLQQLSTLTNGLAFFYPDTANSTALNDAFTATVTSRSGLSTEVLPVQLYSGALTVPGNSPVSDTFVIDSSIGLETVLLFSWLDEPISVEVEDPDGVRINSSDTSQYRVDMAAKIVSVAITDIAKPGEWMFTVDSDSNQAEVVIVTIESKPTSTTEAPITVNAVVGSQTLNHRSTPTMEIYAEVRKGYLPVVNAEVTAVIETPGDATTFLPLYDNGAGADITKNDGIYSAFFLDVDGDGRYSVKVQVSNEGSTASIASRSRRSSGGLPLSPDRYTPTPTTYEPAEAFVRTSSGGVFEVENYAEPVGDTLAPSRITDLAVASASYESSSVTLQWTAVGDDYDQGTASYYDLRFSTSFDALLDNFTLSDPVTEEQVLSGNLSVIGQSGALESLTISVPTRGESVVYFFAITAGDEDENFGGVSNIVSASLEFIPLPTTDTGLEPWAIGVISAASVLAALAVVIFVVVLCKTNSSSKKVNTNTTKPNSDNEKKDGNVYDNSSYVA
ncbi:calcium-activated chloride channel regulator 1-like [Diadema antillarum]|uniref:calcium-activated chloride channel regulator 1-like n=1 Tax=Diadema antillarum TaxID=105358 RepID=UPI003A84D830